MIRLTILVTAIMLATTANAENWEYEKLRNGFHMLTYKTSNLSNCGPGTHNGKSVRSIGNLVFVCDSNDPYMQSLVGVSGCGLDYGKLAQDESFLVSSRGNSVPTSRSTVFEWSRGTYQINAKTNSSVIYELILGSDEHLPLKLERQRHPRFAIGLEFLFEGNASDFLDAYKKMPRKCRMDMR